MCKVIVFMCKAIVFTLKRDDKLKIIIKVLSVLLSAVILSAMTGCSKKEKTPQDSVINYHIAYEPETLDPQIADDDVSDMIILNLFEGLVRLDRDEKIIGGAAESWDISADKMTYRFYLRNGLKWSSGDDMTAADFVYGLYRSVSKQTGSPAAKTLFSIKNAEKINKGELDINELGVTAPDNKTVVIELEYPDSEIMNVLTTPAAMPCSKKFFESSVGQYGRDDSKILCNGPFCINEGRWESGKTIYLSKNKYYTGENKPVPAGVRLNITSEMDDVCQSIINGETDCGAINNSDLPKAQNKSLNLTAFNDTIHGISFNTDSDVLNNSDIRKALLSAIDIKKILKELSEDCSQTDELIPDTAEIEDQSYRKMAGHIGYELSENPSDLLSRGLADSELSVCPEMTILCCDDENTQSVVSNIIECWNSFTGAYFNKKPLPEDELQSRIKNGSYQIAIVPLKINSTSPLGTLECFTSYAGNNPCSYSSDEYDNMISEIKKNLTTASTEKIHDAEKMIMEESMFYPLYTRNRYYASAENVTDVIFHPFGGDIDFSCAVKIEKD